MSVSSILDSIFPSFGNMHDEQKTGFIVPATKDVIEQQAFQYFPSEVSDTRDVGWQFQDIPGSSHPIAYWSNSGARSISFTAQFSRDWNGNMTPDDITNGDVPFFFDSQKNRNPDLRAVAKWLRWYTYPLYEQDGTNRLPSYCLYCLGFNLDGMEAMNCW